MAESVLTARDLNRAFLARQMLLERADLAPLEAIRRLVAVQGQAPRAPFLGLWARLKTFDPAELRRLIADRQVIRATLMRATLHVMAADDFLALRPALRGNMLTRPADGGEPSLYLPGGLRVTMEELGPILDLARAHFAAPRPFESLREAVEAAGHGDVRVMAYAARILLPLLQAPDGAEFGYKPGGDFVLAKAWLGEEVAAASHPSELVGRSVAAHGPATPADFATWSGEKGAAPLFEALGDELVRFRDERKRVLFDLKDAPRPGADALAPPRLLPDFDGVLLGHQDRARIVAPENLAKAITSKNLLVPPVLLIDGFVAGTWRLELKKKTAQAAITAFGPLKPRDKAALEAEAQALLKTFAPEAKPDITFAET